MAMNESQLSHYNFYDIMFLLTHKSVFRFANALQMNIEIVEQGCL